MKIFTGKVISKKMDKTATVLVERFVVHKKYQKRFRLSKKFQVHDELNLTKVGDVVKFTPCAPISKMKRWRVILEKPIKKEKSVEVIEKTKSKGKKKSQPSS